MSGRSPSTASSRRCASRRDPADVARAAQRLVGARAPVIICGGGVVIAGASGALQTLAETLKAAVCVTVSGQGSLADTHPLNAGVVGSNGGVMATRDVVAAADVVLFVGCRAGSTSTEHWRFPNRDVPILHIDIDPMVIGANYLTEVGLVGDAKLALEALGTEVQARLAHRNSDAVDGAGAGRPCQGRPPGAAGTVGQQPWMHRFAPSASCSR